MKSIIISALVILFVITGVVFITGYQKEALFGLVYKSLPSKMATYGTSWYTPAQTSVAYNNLISQIENTPITCAAAQGVFQSDIESARALYPHIIDIQENTVGSCVIHSVWYSFRDKLGKSVLKGGRGKGDIPLSNHNGGKNISALEEIAKDTGRSIGGGGITQKQMMKAYKNNGASNCKIVVLDEKNLTNACSEVKQYIDTGYDCNLYTFNKENMVGHMSTIDTLSVTGSSCSASVYDTTQQDPSRPAGKQTVGLAKNVKDPSLLNVSAPFSASMNLNSASAMCCK